MIMEEERIREGEEKEKEENIIRVPCSESVREDN